MSTIDLLKTLRELAYKNGDSLSISSAKDILQFLFDANLVDKDPDSYGEILVKTGHPIVR